MGKKILGKSGATTVNVSIAVAILSVLTLGGTALGASLFGMVPLGENSPAYADGTYGQLSTRCNIPAEYLQTFNQAANGVAVSPALVAAIFYAGEHGHSWPTITGGCSSGSQCPDPKQCDDNWCTSKAGARGPFQFMEGTWRLYGEGNFVPNACNMEKASRAAAKYLAANIRSNSGTDEEKIRKAIYLYNHSDTYVNTVYEQYLTFADCIDQMAGNGTDATAEWMSVDKNQMNAWMSAKGPNGPIVTGKFAPRGIVLHETMGSNIEGAVSAMTQRKSFVHLIIDQQGTVRKLLPFNARVSNGSGDGNSFAIGIEVVGVNAKDLDSRSSSGNPQFDALLKTMNWLISTYKMPNEKGNPTRLAAKQGIFGHQQVQGKEPMSGCRTRKRDPGARYLNAVWTALSSREEGPQCNNLEENY